MLDDTLVLFTTEFGRDAVHRKSAANVVGKGRDHNQYGFYGVARGGRGMKPGMTYGATDDIRVEVGREADDPGMTFMPPFCTRWGSIHERLTYYHNGIQRRADECAWACD